jgi:hypothetical protein
VIVRVIRLGTGLIALTIIKRLVAATATSRERAIR